MHLRLTLVVALVCALLAAACSDGAEHEPLARVVTHGESGRRDIALTFDAGVGGSVDPQAAGEILRVLRESGVRATFSLTGRWAEENRDLLFTIAAGGHQIINGTYDGEPWVHVTGETAPKPASQRKLALTRTEVTVYRYTSRSTLPYARIPGEIDDGVRRDAAANGYDIIVLSSVHFTPPDVRAGLGRTIVDAARPGAIVSLGVSDAEAQQLGGIIDAIRNNGYALVTVDALLAP